ncbi:MAG: glycosyltransferase family 4 protein [Proteobacteria bacterium]|nr:glycosyltransferase family 4 protein [Pseudomonadota bacterium]
MTPVIFFDADAYLMTGPKLMGRHSAGNGFLRAAVAAAAGEDEAMTVAVASNRAVHDFRAFVAEAAPGLRHQVISIHRLDLTAQAGLLFRADTQLIDHARLRLRQGPGAYGLCGLTHTLATKAVMETLSRLPFEPVTPWDALICTSTVARGVAERVLEEAQAQHRWRARSDGDDLMRPMLPIIPLGVHCADYDFSAADRAEARAELGLEPGVIAALSPGRISMNAKAHPYPMMAGLQAAARRTGRRLALIIAGQAEKPSTLEMFVRSAAELCPDVQAVFVDGADAARFRRSWAAADLFVSLSDNIQETFGLTPLEAMASGLPALVSDWDGYKDTIRDGIDGFRVTTWAPGPGAGAQIAQDFQSGALTYGEYMARAAGAVAVDMGVLAQRLDALIGDADLRARMGASGRARARDTYDWAVVYRQYQALWAEQEAVRQRALADPATQAWLAAAPRRSPDHLGPFDAFEAFPTHHVTLETVAALGAVASPEAYRRLVTQETISHWYVVPEVFNNFHRCLADGPLTLAELAARSGIAPQATLEAVARLAKLDAIALRTS